MMTIPTATYRVQLNDHFTFEDLRSILDYLCELGISTVYASPVTTAFRGSQHGYDVADPLHLNPEIGTERQFEGLAAELKKRGMNWLQDIVPNHMVWSTQNPWLNDVLERGKTSPYYSYFDILPEPVDLLGDRLMAPFLGSTLTDCLHKRELSLEFTERGFVIRYFDEDWPVAIQLYPWICTVMGDCPRELKISLDELVIASLSGVEEWQSVKQGWLRAVADDPASTGFIRRQVGFFNKRLNLVETLLGSQHYVLTHHRLSAAVMNYRRFFTVNSLICLRMESEAVFSNYHREIRRWYSRGLIQGLRIDHIDGLAAPRQYIDRLRQTFGKDCYLIAEKILARDESLPTNWDLQGTTGYEFLYLADQVLTDAKGSRELLDFYRREIIDLPDYPRLVMERKSDFLRKQMGGELDNLIALLRGLTMLGAAGQDITKLREALAMLLACFPVYRLYPDGGPWGPGDERIIDEAFGLATRNCPASRPELTYLRDLCREPGRDAEQEFSRQRSFFLQRLMQFTGPLAAKGIEDTAFYVYDPYISHNEVGDTPAMAGLSVADFHQKMIERQRVLPYSLNATTTHDTKRGEDARIRLNLLSAQPREWIGGVREWREMNRSLIVETGGRRAPSANDEYLIYQALLGGFPEDGEITDAFRERFSAYLRKALREAKAETNYDDPDTGYEKACQDFATALLAPGSTFLPLFRKVSGTVIRESYAYCLAQLLIKLTAPGIPDIYQGAECWETSFVDPDNRREVAFGHRIKVLRGIKVKEAIGDAAALAFVLDHPGNGAMKIWVIYRALQYRKAHPDLFSAGGYLPLEVEGPVLAYARVHGTEWAITAVPLISTVELPDIGFHIGLPAGAPKVWRNSFTGTVHHASAGVLDWKEGWRRFPVAMLTGSE
jgi:(1->4)-alpha-D-glucan 1-alpha-D-glucosylmutase